MSIQKTLTFSLNEIDAVAQDVWALNNSCAVYTFTGSLGAGKTTLIQSMLRSAGVTDLVTSPTFTIVNVYHNAAHHNFFHFDLYRIKSLNEFLQGAFDEYLYAPNSWCFIEWPQIIMPLLTHNVCHVNIEYLENEKRKLSYTVIR
jgi:tRNA threonylcarbamoyladenosine biosynthesis protein TsaE